MLRLSQALGPAETACRDVGSVDDNEDNGADECCAICALPASNGGRGADARCVGCNDTTGWALAMPPPSVPDALGSVLRDALVEASSKATVTGWLGEDARPERSLEANMRALNAALRATARRGDVAPDSETPSTSDLTAREVARVVCIGPALAVAAGVLGSAKLCAPLSRALRLAILACESAGNSATVATSRSSTFAAAAERLRDAAGADAPITLPVLCSAVCAPRALELAESALRGEARAMALACLHGTGCDCGAIMGGGFL